MDQDNTLLNEGLNNSSEVPANEVSDILPTEENIPSEEIKPEIPEINFAVLKTEEIVAEMQKLIETCPTGQIKDVMEKLPEIFEKQYKQEYEQALADFTADGTPAADFNYKNENKEKFYDLYKLFKEKRNYCRKADRSRPGKKSSDQAPVDWRTERIGTKGRSTQ